MYGCKSNNFQLELGERSVTCSSVKCRSLFGKKITSLPFNFYPPLLGKQELNDHYPCIEKLIDQTQQLNKQYLEYKTFDQLEDHFVKEHGLKCVNPSIVSELYLEDTYEQQLKGYKKSLKQNIRTTSKKLHEEGITLEISSSIKDLKSWYHLLVKLYRDKHQMITQPFGLYKRLLLNNEKKEGWGSTLFIARKRNEMIGGIFVIWDKDHWEYSWAATNPDYNRLGINTLLVDFAIQEAIRSGAKTFSFGSTPPSDEKLIYFKSRWGCTTKPIYYYYWNHEPKPVDLNNDFKIIRKVFQYVPLPILKFIPKYLVPLLT